MQKLKTTTLSIIIGLTFAAGITYATTAWNNGDGCTNCGTTNITSGNVISAENIKANFEYLYSKSLGGNLTPPVCTGEGRALQWDGSNWGCLITQHEDSLLIGGTHNFADCTAIGGNTEGTLDGFLCRVHGDVCPSGWSQYSNWSSTSVSRCAGAAWLCGTSCATLSHNFDDRQVETCIFSVGHNFMRCDVNSEICNADMQEIGCK